MQFFSNAQRISYTLIFSIIVVTKPVCLMDHFRFILIVFFLSNALITYGQDKPEIKILRSSIHLSGSTLLYVGMSQL